MIRGTPLAARGGMTRNHVGSRGVLLGVALGVWSIGCTPGASGPEPLPSSMTLVVSHLSTQHPDSRYGTSYGFDLDGAVSNQATTRCDDGFDDVGPGGTEGIDNRFGTLGVALFDLTYDQNEHRTLQAALDEALVQGDWLRTIRLSGIDDATTDPDVTVTIATATSGASLPRASDGSIAAGATVTAGTDLATVHGRIVAGVLSFELDSLSITLGDLYPEATIHDLRVAGAITPRGLADANVGGSITFEDAFQLAMATGGTSLTREQLRMVLLPDLDPDTSGGTCASVSVGLGLRAVPAVIAAP